MLFRSIAADSLGAKQCGKLVYQIAKNKVDHVITLPDEAILAAQKTLWQEYHLASEAGGSAAFAALQSGAYKPDPGEHVGIVLCGSNVELTKLNELVSQD